MECLPPLPRPKRFPYEKIASTDYLQELFYDRFVIGDDTPNELWPIIGELHNFFEAEKEDEKLPYTYGNLTINQDIGSSLPNYGNASGAIFSTLYRRFIIKDQNGNDEICRIAINSVGMTERSSIWK